MPWISYSISFYRCVPCFCSVSDKVAHLCFCLVRIKMPLLICNVCRQFQKECNASVGCCNYCVNKDLRCGWGCGGRGKGKNCSKILSVSWGGGNSLTIASANLSVPIVIDLDVYSRSSRFATIRIATGSQRFRIARFKSQGQKAFESLLRLYHFLKRLVSSRSTR